MAMIYLLAFFTWLAAYQAVGNDRRFQQGLPPAEKDSEEKVLVWPDLVYTELICMVLVTVVLIVWSLGVTAPLEIGETFTIESAVLDETRRINVYLPPGYSESGAAGLPVLYMPYSFHK